MLERSTPDKADAKQFIYVRPGTVEDLMSDFDAIARGSRITETQTSKGRLRHATLPDGRTVVAREHSSDGRPTLEIQVPEGYPDPALPSRIKVLY
ncbi:MAG: hypothetical protein EAZ99_16545 [Alphaproteobacteria bacterium]|nr:MAG: hypothetical protein EAZ99_16545 [Alphaproteobacteria bacterium]